MTDQADSKEDRLRCLFQAGFRVRLNVCAVSTEEQALAVRRDMQGFLQRIAQTGKNWISFNITPSAIAELVQSCYETGMNELEDEQRERDEAEIPLF